MKQAYKQFNFHQKSLELIFFIDKLVTELVAQGYMLSVRQIYYQLVARNKVKNTENSYKRVASLINDGRLAGLIDWDAIQDRNRSIDKLNAWESPNELLQAGAHQFRKEMWTTQKHRCFCIVEKAALQGVLGGVCREYDVPLLAARGYPSVSVVRELVRDYLMPAWSEDQDVIIFHFGDHDPSGIDMTRDLEERIQLFGEYKGNWDLQRIALNRDQIDEYDPPPNPAKQTDSRFKEYEKEHGDESWELDALDPEVLETLLRDNVTPYIDQTAWDAREIEVAAIKVRLQKNADAFV